MSHSCSEKIEKPEVKEYKEGDVTFYIVVFPQKNARQYGSLQTLLSVLHDYYTTDRYKDY